ncbi:MAG: response regulator [Chthoniobacterales bacterium]
MSSPDPAVLTVDSGAVALDRPKNLGDRYDLIIVDQKMPNLSGVELVDEIRKRGIPGEIISRSTFRRSFAKPTNG